jgi:hypothetical protein
MRGEILVPELPERVSIVNRSRGFAVKLNEIDDRNARRNLDKALLQAIKQKVDLAGRCVRDVVRNRPNGEGVTIAQVPKRAVPAIALALKSRHRWLLKANATPISGHY